MEEIFILRHGQAEDFNEAIHQNDFDRKLTNEGRKKTQKLGIFFNSLEEEPELVLSSPLLRAKETAEIFTTSLIPQPELNIVDFLSSGASSKDISKGLLGYSKYKKVVIVGHAPDLEIFLGKLIKGEQVKLKKGALAKVSLDNSIELSGKLEWLITAKLIGKLKLSFHL